MSAHAQGHRRRPSGALRTCGCPSCGAAHLCQVPARPGPSGCLALCSQWQSPRDGQEELLRSPRRAQARDLQDLVRRSTAQHAPPQKPTQLTATHARTRQPHTRQLCARACRPECQEQTNGYPGAIFKVRLASTLHKALCCPRTAAHAFRAHA